MRLPDTGSGYKDSDGEWDCITNVWRGIYYMKGYDMIIGYVVNSAGTVDDHTDTTRGLVINATNYLCMSGAAGKKLCAAYFLCGLCGGSLKTRGCVCFIFYVFYMFSFTAS